MATMHEFFTRQHEELNRLEASLVKTKSEMEAARTETLASLKAKRDKAVAARESVEKKITDSWAKMQAHMQARKQETDATVEGWKHKREVHKLEGRAQSLEEYADAAIALVNLAQEEAKAASLEAIEARREADEAKEATGSAV